MTSNESTQRFVDSGDGVRIAVYEEGNPDGPTVVLLHGWPDSHVLWDGVVPLLADRFRVIRYDNRGAGKSSVPKPVSAYSMARFSDDFAAVIDAMAPGQPVHVLAHDWGSIGMWEYLRRPGASDRVASFTSVSGPGADHLAGYIRGGLKSPYRPKTFSRALVQAMSIGYTVWLSVPVLAPLAVRTVHAPRLRRRLARRDGIPAARIHQSKTYRSDAANSVKIYPANIFRSASDIAGDRYVDVPVQLIVNTRDPYVRPWIFDVTPQWAPRLWRRDIRAGHWAPMSHPQVLATAVTEFVDFLDGNPPSRALLRAQVGRKRDHFGDTLISVTGAGSGIGRETALAFAREGAELVVSDIDEASVKDTAAQIAARGGIAHAYTLDVADAEAVERFGDDVCAEHGVPDIVVNNAGYRTGRALPGHPARAVGPGAGHQSRWCGERLPGLRPPAGRARHRRPYRQRRVDGGVRAAAVPERVLHQQGRGVHVLRLPAGRTRRGRNRSDHDLPEHRRHQYRAHRAFRRPARPGWPGGGPTPPV